MPDEQKQSVADLNKGIRWEVFIPAFLVVAIAAIVGIVNKEMLTKTGKYANRRKGCKTKV